MTGIIGELCTTPESLNATARAKNKNYLERRIAPQQEIEPEWEIHRETRRHLILRRPKAADESFEDRIWLLLFRLGFSFLNKDRHCLLEYKTYTKQIDVVGRDEHHIFVVQCRTTEIEENTIPARGMLEEFAAHHDEARKAFEQYWGHGSFARVCHVYVTSLLLAQGRNGRWTPIT